MYYTFFRNNKTSTAIVLFLVLFSLFHFILKPSFAYNTDGGFRPFGLGYRHKTVIPVWLVALILAILSYMIIFYGL